MTSFWNTERTKELQSLTANGYSAGKIAQRLNTTRNAVIGKWHRDRIPRPEKPSHHLPYGPRSPRVPHSEKVRALAVAIIDRKAASDAAKSLGLHQTSLVSFRRDNWPEIMDTVCRIWAERKRSNQ